ncbi:5-formyltetrahydrofolate cyclo-ligase [Vibrio cholerae]|nr:5-formyltetrahydrofolate cyclo-ligase [Vibrio cholerae]
MGPGGPVGGDRPGGRRPRRRNPPRCLPDFSPSRAPEARSTKPPSAPHRRSEPTGSAQGPTIACYLAVDPEPDTVPLLTELHRRGYGIVVPICERAYQLTWAAWHPGILLQHSVRAPVDEPTGPRLSFGKLPDVRLILVPALAVDSSGHRVGQGGGYYDRFLAQYPADAPGAVPRMGIVYRSEVLPTGTIPSEPHDQKLDGAFTADGVITFGGHHASV